MASFMGSSGFRAPGLGFLKALTLIVPSQTTAAYGAGALFVTIRIALGGWTILVFTLCSAKPERDLHLYWP